jgi:hypothetical protein
MKRFSLTVALLIGLAWSPPARAETLTVTSALDTMIIKDFPTNSNGIGPSVFVGDNATPAPRLALYEFNLSSIPANAIISSVQLTLPITIHQGSQRSETIGLFVLTTPWGEGTSDGGGGSGATATTGDATWFDSDYPGTPWNNPNGGGDYLSRTNDSSTQATVSFTSTAAAYSGGPGSQLVNDVTQWVDGAQANDGWILIGNETLSATAYGFGTKDNSNPALWPELVVNYTVTPEPTSLALLSLSAVGLGGWRGWRRRRAGSK